MRLRGPRAVWILFAADALAIVLTSSRVPARELYNAVDSRRGVRLGTAAAPLVGRE
jgi:hypothetical protein